MSYPPVMASPSGKTTGEKLLDARSVAETFGRTLRTLSNWERSGLLVPIRHAGLRYYRVSEVRELWLRSNDIVMDQ